MLDKFRERKIKQLREEFKGSGWDGLAVELFVQEVISEVEEAIGGEIQTTDEKHGEVGTGRGEIEYRNGSNSRKSHFEDALNNKE